MRSVFTLLVVVAALTLAGCKKEPTSATKPAQPAAPSADKPQVPPRPPSGEMMAGSHILIAYKGAMRARPNVTRSKEDALKRAKELAATAKKDPSKFADLAKANSDGPSGPRGGDLGAWPQGRMVPAFDQAISKMKIGDVSDPVETPFGFHVMKRNSLPPTYAGSHILIAYKGAMRARPEITRSKDEARALAQKLVKDARANPDAFSDLAQKNSDGPSKTKGGSLGTWAKGRMMPAFDEAIAKLKIGGVSDIVETPFGFHVIKREDPANVR